VDVWANLAEMPHRFVTEDVDQIQQYVGLVQVQTVVCVYKVAKAEIVFAQQHLVCTVALERQDFAQQTEVRTVE
tara:strand:- start:492 stop:713 length:222 start_codon:yes stop_codon:yes gene_type:complete